MARPDNIIVDEGTAMKKRVAFLLIVSFLFFATEAFAKKVIGVTAFKNLTKDNNITWLEIGIADSVSYKLRNVEDYIVVDRTNVDKLMEEVALGQTGVIDEDSAKQAGKALGADLIVVGNFQKFGNQVRISARIVEVESHKVLKQVQATGILDQIFDLQDQIALKIIDETNISITSAVKERIKNNATRNISAYEYFVKGQKYLLFQLDYIKAIEMYNKAVEIDDRYSLAYAGLGKAYSLRSWELRNYHNRTDPSLVEKSYKYSTKALEIDPYLDEAHVSLARYYQEVDQNKVPNKWKLCEKEARKAIEINPNNSEAYFLLSKVFAYDDKKEEHYLLETIERNKFFTDAHNNLGVIYLNRGDYDQALKYFKNAVDIDPGYKVGYMNQGVVYERKGQYHDAVEMYKAVLEKYPKYSLGLRNLGIGYRQLKEYDKALDAFEKAIKVDKKDFKAWSEKAYIYLLKGEYNTAIKYYKDSLKLNNTYRYTLANLGYCYSQLGKYKQAIPYLENAHKYNNDYAWAAGYLGWIYRYKLNDMQNAKYWYGEALKRDPNNNDYRTNYNQLQ